MANEPHILVVEDNRTIRELIIRYLSEHGVNNPLAESGVITTSKISP